MGKIHVITVLNDKIYSESSKKTVGYYYDLIDAIDKVQNNVNDMHEGCFRYCVIESIGEGLYQYDYNPLWFEWKDDGYEVIDKPGIFKWKFGFYMG